MSQAPQYPTEGAPEAPSSIDLSAIGPADMVWHWCEVEELQGTRGATFPSRFSAQATDGYLDTRLHDWVDRRLAEVGARTHLRGINVRRLARKVVWSEHEPWRWCEDVCQEQGAARVLRVLQIAPEIAVLRVFREITEHLAECAKRDRRL